MTRTPRKSSPRRAPRPVTKLRGVTSPDARVRWSRILAAQTRIATGYYDREDVKSYLVEAIYHELRRH